jgi:hypothetical protein
MAALLARMRQPHDLTRLTLLLLVLASLRLRSYSLMEPERPARSGPSQPTTQRRKGFNIKRPRSRFL